MPTRTQIVRVPARPRLPWPDRGDLQLVHGTAAKRVRALDADLAAASDKTNHDRGPSAGLRTDRSGFAPSVMARGYGGGMADHEDWAPGDVAAMVANPFYAINIDEGLALLHEPLISEDDWVRANVGLIEELGPEAYLHNLLSILKGNYPRN